MVPLILFLVAISTVLGLGLLGTFHMRLLSFGTQTIEYWYFTPTEKKTTRRFSLRKAAENLRALTDSSSLLEALFWPTPSLKLKSYHE